MGVVRICRTDWLPRGESAHIMISMRLMRLNARICSCVMTAVVTVRLPISCSSTPRVVPRSSFQVAYLTAARPTTAEKAIGNRVVAWV